ncbi:intracellular protein transporter USO1-like protein [Thalictrum thalictroides]|uniref:Intracellular protein transporter USO1-like protein n=1 Tax=Thalictrum thalictroides TaxID=46969 RepID=A0A7J6W7E6_THATH|nr:intracellular protein transporter USO1-like protein [Thalictrum thalictroides]
MESEEKGRKEGAEKQEIGGLKWKRGVLVGKKGGPTTPSSTWKLEELELELEHKGRCAAQDNKRTSSSVSARKLCANLWEIQQQQQHYYLPLAKMSKGGMRIRHYKEKGIDFPNNLAHPSHSPPHQVATYYPPSTPASSLDSRRLGESSHSLKTSTEFLKVLNRIWSLEEQHASNVSLVKALKIELNLAKSHIKELLQEQQADHHEIDDLMKQVADDKHFRKNKDNDRIKAALQSVRDELEDERKLRRRSESLHRKLARELSDVKSTFSRALKELEREKKARTMLEEFCDEFARGIGDYEQEVRSLRHKSENDPAGRDDQDRLIVHISEAWLDERLQMKLAESRCDMAEKNTIVDKLSFEIETFLKARRTGNLNSNDFSSTRDSKINGYLRRHSLESYPLHGATSAPQDVDDEEDSSSDSHCFELENKNMGDKTANGISNPKLHELGEEDVEENYLEETRKTNSVKKKLGTVERFKGRNLSSSQVQVEEHMNRAMSCNERKTPYLNKEEKGGQEANETSISKKSENIEATDGRRGKKDGTHGSNSNYVIDDLLKRSRLLLADSGRKEVHREDDGREDSAWKGIASPVQQWVSRFAAPDLEISESSSQWASIVKGNTLKARLMEARLEGQHSRIKASKG